MTVILLLCGIVVICFAFVLLFGAPYLPTLTVQTKAAMELAGPGAGKTMLELGCGDGKVLIAAAANGWQVIGYELNPLLAAVSWLRTRRYRRQVRVVCGNFWKQKWPDCDAIFVFLLPKYMKKLDKKIIQECRKDVKLVSFAFEIPDKNPAAQSNGVRLYTYHLHAR